MSAPSTIVPLGPDNAVRVVLHRVEDGAPIDGLSFGLDSFAPDQSGLAVVAAHLLFNGTGHDRARSNIRETALPSLARIADTASADLINYNGRTVHVIIDVTTLTTSVIPTIQGKDIASDKYYDVLVGASITTTGLTVLKVGSGIAPLANAAAQDMIPRIWRVSMNHFDSTTMTYSVGVSTGV